MPSFNSSIYSKFKKIDDLSENLSIKDLKYIEGKLGMELDSVLESLKDLNKSSSDDRIFEMVC